MASENDEEEPVMVYRLTVQLDPEVGSPSVFEERHRSLAAARKRVDRYVAEGYTVFEDESDSFTHYPPSRILRIDVSEIEDD